MPRILTPLAVTCALVACGGIAFDQITCPDRQSIVVDAGDQFIGYSCFLPRFQFVAEPCNPCLCCSNICATETTCQ